jgi:Na+:H+ antiporter
VLKSGILASRPLALADTTLIFAVVAAIVALGFLGEQLFRRTGVPSFLFLILTGIFLGPAFHVFSGVDLRPILGLFAELTLVMILFYSGFEMKLRGVAEGGGRAVLLVILYFTLASISLGLFGYYVLRWDLVQSFIFGSIIGGQTSTPVVAPLARSLKLPQDSVTLLTIESVMNSIVGIIVFLALIQVYFSGVIDLSASLTGVAATFSIGIVPATVMSFVWLFTLQKVKDQKYTYVLTLGMILLTYSMTEALGGSGELAVFIFGLIFGNYKILNLIRDKQIDMESLTKKLSEIQDEISFLLNTLFFVFLGLTFDIKVTDIQTDLMLGLAFTGILLGARAVSVFVSTVRSPISHNRPELILLSAQGVTQATLAILALNEGIPLGNTFLGLVAYVIILTNLVTTAGSFWVRRKLSFGFRDFMQSLQSDEGNVTG